MSTKPIVSVVIGSYNRLSYLQSAIATLRQEIKHLSAEVIIVDGGSNDGSIEWLIQQKDIITIIQYNRGEWMDKKIERRSWGYFMNLGFRAASGTYICMLSDDCLVVPGAIKNGLAHAEKKRKEKGNVGMVAFYWRNWPEQEKYWVGVAWGNRMFVNHGLYLREALEKVNFIDDEYFFFYHADGDLALRIWEAGYVCIDSPDSFVEHFSDANTEIRISNQEQQKQDWRTYTKRWEHLSMPEADWIEKSYTDPHHTAERYWQKDSSNKIKLWRKK